MIDDPELRMLFQAESEERLKSLEEGLKHIQEDPTDLELLEEIFRDAHTIKGSARMLSIRSVELLAHTLEDGLDLVREAKLPLTPKIMDIVYYGVDAIRQFVEEEVAGIKPTLELSAALAQIGQLATEIEKEIKQGKSAFPAEEIPADKQAAVKEPDPLSKPVVEAIKEPSEADKMKAALAIKTEQKAENREKMPAPPKHAEVRRPSISTIRIDTQQISELLTQAADLTVAKNRIFRLFEQIEEMQEFWEKKSRQLGQVIADAQATSKAEVMRDHSKITSELSELLKKIVDSLSKLRADSYGDVHKLETIASSFVDRIRKLTLVPLSKLFELFPRMVQDVARACNKEVDFFMEGSEITVDKKIIEDMKDPIMHLLRNAVSHGIEAPEVRLQNDKPRRGTIHLKAEQTSNNIIFEIKDDGKGISLPAIKAKALEKEMYTESELNEMHDADIQALIFQPGFSTAPQISQISGRGVGLDVVQTQIRKLNGTLQVDSKPGMGCRFVVQLAITLVNTHVMLFQVDKRSYAIPIELIESCNLISIDRLSTIEGYDVVFLQDQPISLVSLRKLIGADLPESAQETPHANNLFSCIVLNFTGKRLALIVDAILDEQKVVVTQPGKLFSGLRWLIGETILKTGEVCLILNPFDLMNLGSTSGSIASLGLKKKRQSSHKRKKKILLVDDSYTIRLMVSRELEEEGFEILQAINGLEGLEMLKTHQVDAVISDIEMPEMDGLTMVSAIRRNKDLYALPIILFSTKASPEDRQKGLEVGANFYMAKSEYNQSDLIKTLRELLF